MYKQTDSACSTADTENAGSVFGWNFWLLASIFGALWRRNCEFQFSKMGEVAYLIDSTRVSEGDTGSTKFDESFCSTPWKLQIIIESPTLSSSEYLSWNCTFEVTLWGNQIYGWIARHCSVRSGQQSFGCTQFRTNQSPKSIRFDSHEKKKLKKNKIPGWRHHRCMLLSTYRLHSMTLTSGNHDVKVTPDMMVKRILMFK